MPPAPVVPGGAPCPRAFCPPGRAGMGQPGDFGAFRFEARWPQLTRNVELLAMDPTPS
jgi:hypothetical protein